jgi:DNA/RNA endonuclease YhcR with UshA esterase domain
MKALILAFGLALAAIPAAAETIAPNEAPLRVGQIVTVEGVVSEVHHAASGKVTFIDMGGHYPNNSFAGVIFKDDGSKFPDVDALSGKTIDITGSVRSYRGKPEIILNDTGQIKIK